MHFRPDWTMTKDIVDAHWGRKNSVMRNLQLKERKSELLAFPPDFLSLFTLIVTG